MPFSALPIDALTGKSFQSLQPCRVPWTARNACTWPSWPSRCAEPRLAQIGCHTPCQALTRSAMHRRRSDTTRWCVPGTGRELCPVGRWRISRSCLAPRRRLPSHMPPVDRLGELAGVPQVTSMKQVGAMVGDQELSVSPWCPTARIVRKHAFWERSADPASPD